jgi:hypothetical protein
MSKGKASKVEIQKGPVNLSEQYSGKFRKEPEMTRRDIEMNEMRQSAKTLTLHQPKQ